MTRLASLALAALLGAALPSCGQARSGPLEPVEIHLGEDECAHCKMIISDDRHAAEVVTGQGSAAFYDDLGCLLMKAAAGARPDPGGVFVRAFDGSGWLRGDTAFVLRSREIRSPMGFGFAAFASRDAAELEARRRPGASIAPLATLLRDGAAPTLPGDVTGHSTASQGEIQP